MGHLRGYREYGIALIEQAVLLGLDEVGIYRGLTHRRTRVNPGKHRTARIGIAGEGGHGACNGKQESRGNRISGFHFDLQIKLRD